jgi:hypothetical protein
VRTPPGIHTTCRSAFIRRRYRVLARRQPVDTSLSGRAATAAPDEVE